jgi:hypothetical protein
MIEPDPIVGHASTPDVDMAAAAHRLSDKMEALTETAAFIKEDRYKRDQRKTGRRIIGAYGLWVLDIAIIIAGITYGGHVASVSECQAKQNDAFRSSSLASREARDRQDDQQIIQLDQQLALFAGLGNPNINQNERATAGAQYVKSIADLKATILAAKKKRADNPLPSGNCS